MLRLVQVVDQAIGYVAPTAYVSAERNDGEEYDEEEEAHAHHHHHHAQQPTPSPLSNLYYSSTVQEKWVDYPEEYAEYERAGWKKEGEIAIERANKEAMEGVEKI